MLKLPFCRIKDITSVNKTFHISAKTKNSNFSRSNSNFSILTPTFSRDGFYESCFQNPIENSAHSLKSTRASHSAQYCRYQTYSDAPKNSFSPQSIPQWNGLSPLVVNSQRSLGHSSFSKKHIRKIFLLFWFVFFIKIPNLHSLE